MINQGEKNLTPLVLMKRVQDHMYKHGNRNSGDSKPLIRLFKRKELVQPQMLGYERVVETVYRDMLQTQHKLERQKTGILIATNGKSRTRKLAEPRKIIPDHLIHDIFSMYFRDLSEMIVVSEYNETKYELLKTMVDSVMRIVTQSSYVSSFFFTREISNFLYTLFTDLLELDYDLATKILSAINADPNEHEQQTDEEARQALQEVLNRPVVVRAFDTALKDAEEASREISDVFKKDIGKSISDVEKVSDYESVLKTVENIAVRKNDVEHLLNNILKASTQYFSNQWIEKDISIFEAEEVDELLDLEYMLGDHRKFHLQDLVTTGKEYKGALDVYIDCSGSMGYDSRVGSDIIMAKAVAIKMLKMGIVNHVYFFDTSLSPPYDDMLSILQFSSGGGTDFSMVTHHINQHNNNAIIITDGEDYSAGLYLKRVFWFGVGRAKFRNFNKCEVSRQYLENRQCVLYNESTGRSEYITV